MAAAAPPGPGQTTQAQPALPPSAEARAAFELQLRAHGHDPSLVEPESVLEAILSHGLSASLTIGGRCAAYALVHFCRLETDGIPRLHEPPPPPPQEEAPSSAPPPGFDVFLHDLVVDPEFRGLGLSGALVRGLLRRHPRVHLVSLPASVSYWRHAGATEADPPGGPGGVPDCYPEGSVFFVLRRRLEAAAAAGREGEGGGVREASTLQLFSSADGLAASSFAEAAGGGAEGEGG